VTETRRLRDFGLIPGTLDCGLRNSICDVPGVLVGHVTLSDGPVQTGVTAVVPQDGNLFRQKLEAAVHVINGFGKSAGTLQVAELGCLETPIILTNTLSVGTAATGLIRHMLTDNPDIGTSTGTVNPLVFECNDGYLNDIRGLHIREEQIAQAIAAASADCAEGSVGAGTGMSCYQLKGGIGTASRRFKLDDKTYCLGTLVLTNMGRLADLMVCGRPVGTKLTAQDAARDAADHLWAGGTVHDKPDDRADKRDQGSIIVIIATDAPLDSRQLGRLCRRAESGIARTGNQLSGGSGEVVLAFSTARRIPHYPDADILTTQTVHDDRLDRLFRAVIETTEEAILNSMLAAHAVCGRDGHRRESLATLLPDCLD